MYMYTVCMYCSCDVIPFPLVVYISSSVCVLCTTFVYILKQCCLLVYRLFTLIYFTTCKYIADLVVVVDY